MDINVPCAEILDCTVQPAIEGAFFGQVASGKLVIRSVDVGNFESPLLKSIQDKYPFLADPRVSDSLAKYPLLGYTSKQDAIGLVIVPHGDGSYRRECLWELKLTTGARAWCKKKAVSHVFHII